MLFQLLIGIFIFYKKVSNLIAVQILRQDKYSLAQFENKNKVAMNNYLRMVSDNRVKLIIFNILVCFCIGEMLNAYIVTINNNIIWSINIPKDIYNNQSFIPLFLLKKLNLLNYLILERFALFHLWLWLIVFLKTLYILGLFIYI